MHPKRKRVSSIAWLYDVVDTVRSNGGFISEEELLRRTLCPCVDSYIDILMDHPSLHVDSSGVHWTPVANVTNQAQLYSFLRREYPRAYRAVDLHGLYPHVQADLRELIFDRRCTQLDAVSFSVCCFPSESNAQTVSRAVIRLWRNEE